jgi:hypothetical protein
MALPLSPAVGSVVCIPVIHPVQITADVAATVHKVYPGIKGRIIKVVAIPGIHGGTTPVTDLDITANKSGTALHSTVIAAVNASTAASTDAVLSPTLSTTAATVAIAEDDYLSNLYDVTGGSSPTINGAGVLYYIARE